MSLQQHLFFTIGNHRQCQDQDFANLPDPFGSYRTKLISKDFEAVIDNDVAAFDHRIKDKGLDHIKDPGMQSYMQREIAR